MKIETFLEFIDSMGEQQVDEDFGNLKQFSKTVLKPISKAAKNRRNSGTSAIGQNSTVTKATGRVTGAMVKRALAGEGEERVIAVVIKIGDTDVMGIAPGEERGYKSVAMDNDFTSEIFSRADSTEGHTAAQDFADTVLGDKFGVNTHGDVDHVSDTVVSAIIAKLIKVAKEIGQELSAYFIGADAERKSTSAERTMSRKGVEVKPSGIGDPRHDISKNRSPRWGRIKPEYERYVDSLKSDLKTRLEKFKNSKLSTITSTEDLIEYLQEHGLGDRFSYEGNKMTFYRSDNIERGMTDQGSSPLGDSRMKVEYKNSEFEYGGSEELYNRRSQIRRNTIAELQPKVEAGEMSEDELDDEIANRIQAWLRDEKLIGGVVIYLERNKDNKLQLDIADVEIKYGISGI